MDSAFLKLHSLKCLKVIVILYIAIRFMLHDDLLAWLFAKQRAAVSCSTSCSVKSFFSRNI